MSARKWALADVRGRVYLMTPTGSALVSIRAESAEGGAAFDGITRLIDAAPELAEACRAALTWWHSKPANIYKKEPDWLPVVRAALLLAGVKP